MPDSISALTPPQTLLPPKQEAVGTVPEAGEMRFRELWTDKEKGFGFADLLDIVNPLQHLPVIGTIYRAITGDEISLGARLVGGALYGGPAGIISAAALAASEQATGAEPGRQIVAVLEDLFDGSDEAAPARLADNADAAKLAAVAPAAGTPAATTDAAPADPAPDAPPPAAIAAAATAAPVPVLRPAAFVTTPPGAAAARPAATVARPAPRAFPAFPVTHMPVSRGVPLPLYPGLTPQAGGSRLPPGAALAPHIGAAGPDAQSRRILAKVEEARRAQAALLLANVNAAAALPAASAADGNDKAGRDADPFRTHPPIPPPGAPPVWMGRAMERALNGYRQSQGLRDAAAPAAAPAP